MRVLAVDTTTRRGSLAVVTADGVEAEVRVTTADGHSRWLVGSVETTLRGLGLEASPQELATRLQHLERLGQVKRSEAGELEIAGEIRRRWLEGQGREGDVRADR